MTNIEKYLTAYLLSTKGVKWKGNVQRHMAQPIRGMEELISQYKSGDYSVPINTNRETICERGKKRHIVPIRFMERVNEHMLCDEILLPAFADTLIYSNGASLKGKGTDFDRRLMNGYLAKAVKDGYTCAVQFDFKSYFESIPHKTIYDILTKKITDENAVNLTMNVVLSYQHGNILLAYKRGDISEEERDAQINDLYNLQGHGVCLGSQVSQIFALIVPNDLDHYIKDNLRMRYYVRYMDDGIILCRNKEEARFVLTKITERIKRTGLVFNQKKTTIVKLTKGFVFLKVVYRVRGNKIIKTLYKTSIIRMRRKLKKFSGLIAKGVICEEDIFNSVQSWWSHSFVAKAYHARKNMLKVYKNFFSSKVDWFEVRLMTMKPKCA